VPAPGAAPPTASGALGWPRGGAAGLATEEDVQATVLGVWVDGRESVADSTAVARASAAGQPA
jgi:hypothetical protein